jgi:hypothetical protein
MALICEVKAAADDFLAVDNYFISLEFKLLFRYAYASKSLKRFD